MTSLHDMGEHTKRALDFAAGIGAVTAISLSQAAAIISILAGLASIAWVAMRFYDRLKYGRGSND